MDFAMILVYILAAFLALFLLLAIILVVLLIRITKQIKNVTGAAERTAQHFEGVAANFSKISTPAFFAKMVARKLKSRKK